MFIFVTIVIPSSHPPKSNIALPSKYQEFIDVLEKVKANTLPNHHSYGCLIDLQPEKDPP